MKMPEHQENGSNSSSTMTRTKNGRCRSFHFRYLELCRSKNTAPLNDIRKNNKDQTTLDFFGDKLSVTDWLLITESIYCDQLLQTIAIRLRKCIGPVLDHIDSERKAKLSKQKPVVFTKFIFSGVIESITTCIEINKNLRVLCLEGLPLSDNYVESIAKSMAANTSLKEVSFARSNIFDNGCEAICNIVKYLENIEKLNLSDTGLTTKGAGYIADMIKIQKISRYTEGWQQSLRYREVDTNSIPGLRVILLARNPQIGDEGLSMIVEVLKEDVWVKVVDMENCGLTDRAAKILLDCLRVNNYLSEFNIGGNPGVGKFLLRSISDQLKRDGQDTRTSEELLKDFGEGRVNGADLMKQPNLTIQQLVNQLKKTNEQLELERRLRKKSEELNEKLTAQIKAYEIKICEQSKDIVPEGYVVVKNESLQSIIRERNEFQKLIEANEEQIVFMDTHKHDFPMHEDHEIEFMEPLPEPTVSPTISARSNGTHRVSSRQQVKIRKVKSEMKYNEPPTREQILKKKETKSDCDYATESDVPRFETNIGDSVANTNSQLTASNSSHHHRHQQQQQRRAVRYASNIQVIKKYEMDEISVSTSRSQESDAPSADSDTLRFNEDVDYRQEKAAYKNCKHITTTPKEYGQGEGAAGKRSPRAIFLGLCGE